MVSKNSLELLITVEIGGDDDDRQYDLDKACVEWGSVELLLQETWNHIHREEQQILAQIRFSGRGNRARRVLVTRELAQIGRR